VRWRTPRCRVAFRSRSFLVGGTACRSHRSIHGRTSDVWHLRGDMEHGIRRYASSPAFSRSLAGLLTSDFIWRVTTH